MSNWVIRLIEQSGYLGGGFLMFLETVFPPIPSEVIMSVAGVAAGQGKLGYVGVVASGTAGAMLGNVLWYLGALAHDELARSEASGALVRPSRNGIRHVRAADSDRAQPRVDPGGPPENE